MEFKFTAEDEAFRSELRTFMKTELPDSWEGAGRYPEEDDWDLNIVIRQKMAEKGRKMDFGKNWILSQNAGVFGNRSTL